MDDQTSKPQTTDTDQLHTLPPKPEGPHQKRLEKWLSIAGTAAVLLIAPAIAVLLIAFVFQPYQVDGPSMQTTLSNNDRLIVWKLPRTWARITGHNFVPKRGDVVIFNESDLGAFGDGSSKQLIKRVIGLPGERVTIQNGRYVVYNSQHPSGFQPDTNPAYGKVITDTEPETSQTTWTLGTNQIFVSGDNRPNSLDSRSFGPVTLKDVIGKLAFRILPLGQAKRF